MTDQKGYKDHAKEQAKAKLDIITAMVERVKHIEDCTDYTDCKLTDQEIAAGVNLSLIGSESLTDDERERYHDYDDAQEEILNSALDVRVRSGWHNPGSGSAPSEYEILLCVGGPAVRIIGALNEHHEPITANLQYQDWGTPWTCLPISIDEENILLTYARFFYFAE